jgi:hypothetical protein
LSTFLLQGQFIIISLTECPLQKSSFLKSIESLQLGFRLLPKTFALLRLFINSFLPKPLTISSLDSKIHPLSMWRRTCFRSCLLQRTFLIKLRNSILDITLPYIEVTKKKNVIKHLARYLIVDRILYGIRIKISDNWPKSRTIKQPISANLQHFYDQYRITNYPQ